MLTIQPCTEKSVLAPYCQKCKRLHSEAFYLYRAENRGEVLAAALFEVTPDVVQVLLYEPPEQEDAYLFDGILRAGLNYAAENGIKTGCIPEAFRYEHRQLFAKLNYPAQTRFDITNFFAKYKNCRGA